eukprot:413951_1
MPHHGVLQSVHIQHHVTVRMQQHVTIRIQHHVAGHINCKSILILITHHSVATTVSIQTHATDPRNILDHGTGQTETADHILDHTLHHAHEVDHMIDKKDTNDTDTKEPIET